MRIEDNIADEIVDVAADGSRIEVSEKGGRPPTARREKEMKAKLRAGESAQIDRGWLLEQLLVVYNSRDCKPSEKIRALELMAKVSGYEATQDADERQALADLMNDMEKDD